MLAAVIDLLVVLLTVASVDQPFPPILVIGIHVVYHGTLTWWLGRTIGKALIGLRVVRPGGRPSAWWSFARSGPGHLLLGFGGLGLLSALVDRNRRAVYDIALGSVVVQETDAALRPRGLADRLLEYADEHQRVAGERKRTIGLLAGFWASLSQVGARLRRWLNMMRGSPSSAGPSITTAVTSTVGMAATAAVTAVAAMAVTVIPRAQPLGEWLVTDRQWVGEPQTVEFEGAGTSQEALVRYLEGQNMNFIGRCDDIDRTVVEPLDGVCYALDAETSDEERHVYMVGLASGSDTGQFVILVRDSTGMWTVDGVVAM